MNDPLAQVEQELSVVVLPVVKPSAALHVVRENDLQAVWSLVAEYVPVPHAVQVASADAEPAA